MLEFVDPGLYFVQDENNFINPLLQVGSGSESNEKSTGSDRKSGSSSLKKNIRSEPGKSRSGTCGQDRNNA